MKGWAASHALGAAALLATALASSTALADYFGSLSLKPGESKQIYIGTTSQNMQVCNDFFSSGSVEVTIAANQPHDLVPGTCAEDIGDRMTLQSRSKGPVSIIYRPIYDQGQGMFDEE